MPMHGPADGAPNGGDDIHIVEESQAIALIVPLATDQPAESPAAAQRETEFARRERKWLQREIDSIRRERDVAIAELDRRDTAN